MKAQWRKYAAVFSIGILALGISAGVAREVHAKDTLIISMGNRPPGEFDPRKRWGLYSQTQILHSALLKKTADLEVVGDFAKTFEVSDNGLTWSFDLHDNFKFFNGEPVTAEDVKFTYEMLKEHGQNWDLSFVETIEILSPNKMVFHLTEPRSTFWAQLTEISILPKAHYNDNYSENPIGSGPYMLV